MAPRAGLRGRGMRDVPGIAPAGKPRDFLVLVRNTGLRQAGRRERKGRAKSVGVGVSEGSVNAGRKNLTNAFPGLGQGGTNTISYCVRR